MRNLYLVIVASIIVSCSNSGGYTIKGKIEKSKGGLVYLKRQIDKRDFLTLDSTTLSDKCEFKFKGQVTSPELLLLEYKGNKAEVFIENSDMFFISKDEKLLNTLLKGSKSNELYSSYLDEIKTINIKSEKYYNSYKRVSSMWMKDSIAYYEKLMNKIDSAEYYLNFDFIKKNSKSVVAAYVGLKNIPLLSRKEYTEIVKVVSILDASILQTEYALKLQDYYSKLRNISLNSTAPDFTINNSINKMVKFSSFTGKTIVLVFWASWCPYCRDENKKDVELQKKFKDVQYIYVSLDDDKTKWLEAIKEDKIVGEQLSELTRWKSNVAKIYMVKSIPFTYVINSERKIVAKNIFGSELENKLKELTLVKK